MDDLISRQAAIDAVRNQDAIISPISDDVLLVDKAMVMTELMMLPSVQPDISEYSDRLWKAAYERGKRDAQANIVQCEDCKWRRNQNGTMAWIPCRALVTPDDFYCKYAERKEQ